LWLGDMGDVPGSNRLDLISALTLITVAGLFAALIAICSITI
jgi:hypothetical protein